MCKKGRIWTVGGEIVKKEIGVQTQSDHPCVRLTPVCFLRSVLSMDLETGGDSSFIYSAIVQGATACTLFT